MTESLVDRPAASLTSVNLNLIPTLQVLLRERNITKAAVLLHVSQPSVSGALARLREVFHDPLLVRVGRHMELTPLARQLVEPVDRACESLGAVLPTAQFDASRTRRVFRIGADDYAASLIGPRMITCLREKAPRAAMAFVEYPLEVGVGRQLSDIDVLIAPRILLSRVVHPDSRTAALMQDQFVHIVAADHPLASKRRVTATDLAGYPHVMNTFFAGLEDVSEPTGMGPTVAELGISRAGRHSVAQVQQFAVIPLMAMLSGSVAIVPRSLAEQVGPFFGSRIVGPVGTPIDVALAWSPRHDTDQGHRWFREHVIEAARARNAS